MPEEEVVLAEDDAEDDVAVEVAAVVGDVEAAEACESSSQKNHRTSCTPNDEIWTSTSFRP